LCPSYDPVPLHVDETFDVGGNSRTSVDDRDYQLPFRFTGKLTNLTFELRLVRLTEDERRAMTLLPAAKD
jgi:arylsulfatase